MLKDKWTLETQCQVKNACYKRPNITRFHLYELPRTGKSVEIESRLVVAYRMGVWGENNKWLLIGVRFLLYKKNFYWSVADSQCCVSFSGTTQPISYAYIPSLDSFPIQVIGVSSWSDKNVLKLLVVMGTYLCKYTKKHQTVP